MAKEKIFGVVILAVIVFLGCWIRTLNIPQLKDVTTGNYTLGPDLDPYLFLRHAQEIVENKLQSTDMIRAAPLGVESYAKSSLMPWAIVAIYKFFKLDSVDFAAIIAPVIFFGLTLIVFFFFVRKLFSSFMSLRLALIGALIATAFYAVIPAMQHRTTAGIPELESLGMLWFWCAFYFFLDAWQSEKIKKQLAFGLLSGIFTGLMVWTWGGYSYIFMTFVVASFLAFFFNKQKKKNFLIYVSWLVPSLAALAAKKALYFTSITTAGIGSVMLCLFVVDFIVFNSKLKRIKEKLKLPESVISLIFVVVISFVALLLINPVFISNIFSRIAENLLHPYTGGRVISTVAENNPANFVDVVGNFGKPFFWLFFFGTLFLFYEATKHFDKKNKLFLNFFFVIFLICSIFTRFSSESVLNGENLISRTLYFSGLVLFAFVLLFLYIRRKESLEDFKNINFSYLLALAFIFWMIISMRGAIRLFFIISPALILASAFLPVKLASYMKTKDDLHKILLLFGVCAVAALLILTFISYRKVTAFSVKSTVPGSYYQQWQKAMAWVRENTPEDAIFVHWWDYGYWVQTLGKRATVVDGGHPVGYWNHMVGRYLMTAQNEKTALQFCKAHNVSYYLIDSTDIGKYPAYSSIGSDATGKDRLSWVSTFLLDEQQTQELRNETLYFYRGGTYLDQDLVLQDQLFPANKAGVGAFILHLKDQTINKVEAVFFYNGKQIKAPIRWVWFDNRKIDLKKNGDELNAMLYIIPRIEKGKIKPLGAALYLSEKALSTQWVRLYLLNETNNFELVHKEDALFVQQLKEVYENIGDFVYVDGFGLLGPIKIWKLNYPQDIELHEEYLKKSGEWAELDYLGT